MFENYFLLEFISKIRIFSVPFHRFFREKSTRNIINFIVGKFENEFIRYSRSNYIWLYHESMLSTIYHYFEYKPMGLYSRELILEFFCQQIIGLIFEGAYNRGGLYSRFYGMMGNGSAISAEQILSMFAEIQSGP